MTGVEIFSATEFQATLPSGWVCTGYEYGELTYHLPTIGPVKILVRSTIRQDGQSAGTGEDSIRCFLVLDSGAPLGFNLIHYTTRVSGWQARLGKVIETLQSFRRVSGDCPRCHIPKSIFLSNTAKNPHRYFAKCGRCSNNFVWLDAPTSQPYYHNVPAAEIVAAIVPPSRSTDVPTINSIPKSNERESERLSVERGGGTTTTVTALLSPAVAAQPDDSPAPSIAGPLSFLSSTRAPVSLVTDIEEANVAPADNASPFIASKYQSAVYDFIRNESGNAVVVACPGSGKTTLLKHAAPHLPKGASIAAIAFGKHNAADLQRALPDVQASTFHSLGLSNVKRALPKCVVDTDKTWKLLHRIEDRGGPLADIVSEDGAEIKHLVDLVKSTMAGHTNADLEFVCDRYAITLNGNSDGAYEIARQVLVASDADTATADFGDMLQWCANGRVKSQRFDFLLCDENQDATQAQIECQKVWLKPNGRLIAVGDPRQAIFSWAGAATDSLDQVTRHHNAVNLPLSISYRLPVSHVAALNARFSGANIEARPDAPEGVISNKSYGEMIRTLVDGDMVICRTNAPLVEPCFALIRDGRKATIAGRDIGKGLTVLLSKVEKRNPGASLPQLITALRMYVERECDKLIRSHKNNQCATLQDQSDTLVALSDGAMTTGDIRKKVASVFSDDIRGVTFSSGHRSKGKESTNVYYFHPDLVPHKMAVEPWQLVGESNLDFVMRSRSKSGLYFVSGE